MNQGNSMEVDKRNTNEPSDIPESTVSVINPSIIDVPEITTTDASHSIQKIESQVNDKKIYESRPFFTFIVIFLLLLALGVSLASIIYATGKSTSTSNLPEHIDGSLINDGSVSNSKLEPLSYFTLSSYNVSASCFSQMNRFLDYSETAIMDNLVVKKPFVKTSLIMPGESIFITFDELSYIDFDILVSNDSDFTNFFSNANYCVRKYSCLIFGQQCYLYSNMFSGSVNMVVSASNFGGVGWAISITNNDGFTYYYKMIGIQIKFR
jgi:hypothetical protein